MFITKRVFDPSLTGKAVYISGQDASGGVWDNVFLVSRVEADIIHLITNTGIALKFHMDNFESGVLKMEVWHYKPEPKEAEGPEENVWSLAFKEDPKPTIKRPKKDIQRRTDAQQMQDARLVADILQRNNREMKTEEILNAVNAAGANWKTQSATGHIYRAMKTIPAIKKVGFGLYKYEK